MPRFFGSLRLPRQLSRPARPAEIPAEGIFFQARAGGAGRGMGSLLRPMAWQRASEQPGCSPGAGSSRRNPSRGSGGKRLLQGGCCVRPRSRSPSCSPLRLSRSGSSDDSCGSEADSFRRPAVSPRASRLGRLSAARIDIDAHARGGGSATWLVHRRRLAEASRRLLSKARQMATPRLWILMKRSDRRSYTTLEDVDAKRPQGSG